jgi:nicotinamide mononucleotide (NMN) deamidase PncC
VLDALRARGGSLTVAETLTGGGIAARLAPLPGAEALFRRGLVARDPGQLRAAVGLDGPDAPAAALAAALRERSGASHALAVLVALDEGVADSRELGGTIRIGIADGEGTALREARLLGGREWVRLGAMEMGLDCLRRRLLGLPVEERVDFERR